ncbi:MAG: winged helix-turn-helix transcriptional regulator [Cytophagaceae bacterium]|nr:winged helix-turn-helix transcriptional regulator [Gemmatimonadaceae bacterium]
MTYVSALTALADGTRRELMERLRARPHAVGELAIALRVTQPAVSQHLRVLEHARLVSMRAEGRRRIYSVSTEGLVELRRYLESFWQGVLEAFADDDPVPPAQRPPSTTRRRTTRRKPRA